MCPDVGPAAVLGDTGGPRSAPDDDGKQLQVSRVCTLRHIHGNLWSLVKDAKRYFFLMKISGKVAFLRSRTEATAGTHGAGGCASERPALKIEEMGVK